MDRSEQVKFCKLCLNRAFDMNKGTTCNLTGDIANFQDKCDDFKIDSAAYELQKQRQMAAVNEGADSGFFAHENKGMKKGVVGGILMIIIAVVWFFGGLATGYIFFYPPVLLIIGIVALVKGLAEGNLSGEKYKR